MSGIEKRFPQKYNLKASNKPRRIWQNIPKTVVKYDKLYRINSKQFVSRYIIFMYIIPYYTEFSNHFKKTTLVSYAPKSYDFDEEENFKHQNRTNS